jgi:hypothetical protein
MCHRNVFPPTLLFGIPVAVGHDQLQSVMMPKESSIMCRKQRGRRIRSTFAIADIEISNVVGSLRVWIDVEGGNQSCTPAIIMHSFRILSERRLDCAKRNSV